MTEINERIPCPHCGTDKWEAYQKSEHTKAVGVCSECESTFDIEAAARELSQIEMDRLCPPDVLARIRASKCAPKEDTENVNTGLR